jgi:acid phosphatase (class A)
MNFTKSFLTILIVCCCHVAKAQTYFDINSISPNLIDPAIKIGSASWKSEVNQILKLQSKLDLERLDQAIFEKHLQPETIAQFGDPTLTREAFPKLYYLLDRVGDTSRGVTDKIKEYHGQTRPYLADSRIKMLITPSRGSSYPSGHATGSYIYAHILGLLIPAKRQEFESYADKIAQNRILIGMHYPQDIAGGKNLSFLIVGGLTQDKEFQKDFKKAAEEISKRN